MRCLCTRHSNLWQCCSFVNIDPDSNWRLAGSGEGGGGGGGGGDGEYLRELVEVLEADEATAAGPNASHLKRMLSQLKEKRRPLPSLRPLSKRQQGGLSGVAVGLSNSRR